MSEDRSALKLEFASALGILDDEIRAQNVRRHEVGRKLNAAKGKIQHFAERADEQRFAKARHAFQKHMAPGEERDEGAIYDGFVPDDDLAYLGAETGVSFP